MTSRSVGELDHVIAANLKKARKERGLLQRHMAKVLGVSIQQYQKYEVATNRIPATRLWELAKHHNKTMESFFDAPEA